MRLDPKTAEITSINWDSVQERVRAYARDHNLSLSPEYHIPLEVGAEHLRLYNEGAQIPVAEFWPYFRSDAKTLKNITIQYYQSQEIDDLLKDLAVTF